MKHTLFILLMFCAVRGYAQNNYRLSGSYADGRVVENNAVFYYNDQCVFHVTDSEGNVQSVGSGKWTFKIAETDAGYRSVKEDSGDSFNLAISSIAFDDIHLYRNFERKTFDNESSVYYMGIIGFEGTLQSGEYVYAETPVLLNILPSIPTVKILDMEWSNYDEKYHIYDDGLMTLQIQSDRCMRILVEERDIYEGGGMVVIHYFQNNIDSISNIGTLDFWDGDSYFIIRACNDFGSTVSKDTIWINRAVSIKDLTNDCIKFYPNPVKDILYIDRLPEKVFPISVYNENGRIVKHLNDVTSFIDMSDLINGTYFLMYNDTKSKRKAMHKVIKQE